MVSSGPRSYCCHECRRRKVKCDGQKPACQRCTKRGKTCTGFPSSFKFLDNQTSFGSQVQFSQSEPNTPTQLRAGFATPTTQYSRHVTKKQTPSKAWQIKKCSFRPFTPKSQAGVSSRKNPHNREDLPSHGSASSYHVDQHQSQEIQSRTHSTPSRQSDYFLQSSAIPTDHLYRPGITQTDTMPNERSTFSSPQAESLNPNSQLSEYPGRGYYTMARTNTETNPSEFEPQYSPHCYTQDLPLPNFQLVSSPEFMADEELEAYWEVLNAEYMAGCQRYHESGSASYPSSIDGTSYFENRNQHCGIQNEDPGSNSTMDRACCGQPEALSSRELYLCNFFL